MYYVKHTESALWTVGSGEGREWMPVEDHDGYWDALKAAERLNSPMTYQLIETMQEQIKSLTQRVESLEEELSMVGSQDYIADMAARYR